MAVLIGLALGVGVTLIERRLGRRVSLGLAIAFVVVISYVTLQVTDLELGTVLAAMLAFAIPGIANGVREDLTRAK